MARAATLSRWADAIAERDDDGRLTPLALALDALRDRGCDCGEDEPGTCLACVCEAALRDLWEQRAAGAAMLARQMDLAREAESQRDQFARALQSSHAERSKRADELADTAQALRDVCEKLAGLIHTSLSEVCDDVVEIEVMTQRIIQRLIERLAEMRAPRNEGEP
jgi:hypothetical protein